MKTLYVFAVAAVVMFVATCRGDGYDTLRDVENDFQDRFTNNVNERREQMKSMFDPRCLLWTRRNPKCFNGKRSFGTRQVMHLFIFFSFFAFKNLIWVVKGRSAHAPLSLKAVFNGVRNPKIRC